VTARHGRAVILKEVKVFSGVRSFASLRTAEKRRFEAVYLSCYKFGLRFL
jgi:hypothetical protein